MQQFAALTCANAIKHECVAVEVMDEMQRADQNDSVPCNHQSDHICQRFTFEIPTLPLTTKEMEEGEFPE